MSTPLIDPADPRAAAITAALEVPLGLMSTAVDAWSALLAAPDLAAVLAGVEPVLAGVAACREAVVTARDVVPEAAASLDRVDGMLDLLAEHARAMETIARAEAFGIQI